MDWTYQRFERATVLQAQSDVATEATRAAIAESLAGWQVAEIADGFRATGTLGAHAAAAEFRIEAAPPGTRVAIALSVERAGPMGFMLVDAGGYYTGTLGHWLQSIERHAVQKLTGAAEVPPAPKAPVHSPARSRASSCAIGCFMALIFCPLAIYFFCAVVGLATGILSIPGGRDGSSITVHGVWARIISAVVLALYGWVFWSWKRQKKAGLPGDDK